MSATIGDVAYLLNSKKGMKSVNNLLDEYTDFTSAIICATIVR